MDFVVACRQWILGIADRFKASRSEQGASLIEYALLLALIAVVCVIAIQFLGNSTSSTFSRGGSMFPQ